ncbi:hypothetical protein H0X32_02530 [Patescibacteria group bacterium]|nr:hypothetical protein [Patescibacteria group bacterium]
MDPIARLFNSPARLKLLRLFLFNDDIGLTVPDIAFRTNVVATTVRKELKVLIAAGIVRKRSEKGKVGFVANKRFAHYDALQLFLRTTTRVDDAVILTTLKKAGTLRLVALSGLFTGAVETKADLLIVGDKLEDKHLEKLVHTLEAELGRELRFAAFSTEDFRYRVGVYDRLLRDIFDYPHRTLLDKIGISGNLSPK